MNDQSPLDPALRNSLEETMKLEKRDRENRVNNENVKQTDPAYVEDANAKKAYETITDTWVSFREYAQAPLTTHADDWRLRITKMKVLFDAVKQLDMGFFTRRLEDQKDIRSIEDAVGPQYQPLVEPIKRYEAIAQSWWHHAAFVSHFGRKAVTYPTTAEGIRGNQPKYKPPYVSQVSQI